MRARVGFDLSYVSPHPTPLLSLLAARQESRHHCLIEETPPYGTLRTFSDIYGHRTWRATAGPDLLTHRHDAVVEVPFTPDLVLPGLTKVPVAKGAALHLTKPLLSTRAVHR